MVRKFFTFLLVLILLFSIPLSTEAVTDFQQWKFGHQIQNLPEEYWELYTLLPEGAYHSEHVVTVGNVKYGDWGMGPEGVLIQELIDNNVFVRPEEHAKAWGWENNPDVIYVPVSEVQKIYEQAFGAGTFSEFKYKESFSNYEDHFRYEADEDRYAYLRWPSGGGVDSASVYASFVKVETLEGVLELYIRYGGYQSPKISREGVFKLYRDSQMRVAGIDNPYYTSLTWNEEDLLRSGDLDQYLPLYKHTFKENGVGGYYWASTEMVQPENAEQIKAYYEEQKGPPNTSANSDSDKTTDSNHQPSDCSTALLQHSDASADRFKEQRHITVQIWVCIGISAIGLGCAVVLMMIQKKK